MTSPHATVHGDPVAWLEHDHQVIKRRLTELNAATTMPNRQVALDALKSVLALHNAIEENLVYPALATIAQRREGAMQLFHQTAEADVAIFTLQHAVLAGDEAAFAVTAREVTSAIHDHIGIEETQAFPALNAAPIAARAALAAQIIEFKQTLTTPQAIVKT